jgi:hypothetical protein
MQLHSFPSLSVHKKGSFLLISVLVFICNLHFIAAQLEQVGRADPCGCLGRKHLESEYKSQKVEAEAGYSLLVRTWTLEAVRVHWSC